MFSTKWVYRHVCSPTWSLQNGCWKLSRPTYSQSTSKGELYKMTLSFKRRLDLENGVYQPHLPSKPGGYPFYFAHDPTHFAEETGGGIDWKQKLIWEQLIDTCETTETICPYYEPLNLRATHHWLSQGSLTHVIHAIRFASASDICLWRMKKSSANILKSRAGTLISWCLYRQQPYFMVFCAKMTLIIIWTYIWILPNPAGKNPKLLRKRSLHKRAELHVMTSIWKGQWRCSRVVTPCCFSYPASKNHRPHGSKPIIFDYIFN